MIGHRSLYHDGWRAVCPWPGTSFTESGLAVRRADRPTTKLTELDAKGWELYHVAEDFAENHEPRGARTATELIAMIGMWYVEAGKYNVLPIDSRGAAALRRRAAADRGRSQAVRLLPGHPDGAHQRRARVLNQRPHTITAVVDIPEGGAEGVLSRMGGNDGGFSFYVAGRQAHYGYNYVAAEYFQVRARRPSRPGHALSFEFEPTGKPEPMKGNGTPATPSCSSTGNRPARATCR